MKLLFDMELAKILLAIVIGFSGYGVAFLFFTKKFEHINQQILGYVLYITSFSLVILYLLSVGQYRENISLLNFRSLNGIVFHPLIIILPLMLNLFNYIVKLKLDKGKSIGTGNKAGSVTLQIIYSVLIVPVIEEIIFRGFLFCTIFIHYGFAAALIINSTLFALLHINLRVLFFSFIGGILFTCIAYQLKSLNAAIIAHSFYNLLSLIPYLINSSKRLKSRV